MEYFGQNVSEDYDDASAYAFAPHETVKDVASGEHGVINRIVGENAEIYLYESDSYVWRELDIEVIKPISQIELDQACFEWDLTHPDQEVNGRTASYDRHDV